MQCAQGDLNKCKKVDLNDWKKEAKADLTGVAQSAKSKKDDKKPKVLHKKKRKGTGKEKAVSEKVVQKMVKKEADRVKKELQNKGSGQTIDVTGDRVKVRRQDEDVQSFENVDLSPKDIELLRKAFPNRIKYDLAVRELIEMKKNKVQHQVRPVVKKT